MTFMLQLVSFCQLPQSADGVVGRATGDSRTLILVGQGTYYGVNGADRLAALGAT